MDLHYENVPMQYTGKILKCKIFFFFFFFFFFFLAQILLRVCVKTASESNNASSENKGADQ